MVSPAPQHSLWSSLFYLLQSLHSRLASSLASDIPGMSYLRACTPVLSSAQNILFTDVHLANFLTYFKCHPHTSKPSSLTLLFLFSLNFYLNLFFIVCLSLIKYKYHISGILVLLKDILKVPKVMWVTQWVHNKYLLKEWIGSIILGKNTEYKTLVSVHLFWGYHKNSAAKTA